MLSYYAITPPVTGWLEIDLEKEIVDYLWKQIDKSTVSVKDQLAGHISSSFALEDEEEYFQRNVLQEAANKYSESFSASTGYRNVNHVSSGNGLALNGFWVNYQKKHEFNPPHDHGGLFSFVVWMKIPTDSEEQKKLDFLKGTVKPIVSNFDMNYIDTTGGVASYIYEMSPEMEGKMLFFPSKFKHAVYPFYESDDDRITISGNLYYA